MRCGRAPLHPPCARAAGSPDRQRIDSGTRASCQPPVRRPIHAASLARHQPGPADPRPQPIAPPRRHPSLHKLPPPADHSPSLSSQPQRPALARKHINTRQHYSLQQQGTTTTAMQQNAARLLAAAVACLALALAPSSDAQGTAVPSCAAKLVPCTGYLNSTSTAAPAAACCGPLREAAANETACLCAMLLNRAALRAFGVAPEQGLVLARRCNVTTDASACAAAGGIKLARSRVVFLHTAAAAAAAKYSFDHNWLPQ